MSRSPYILVLTGSIGMGKSTTARMFAKAGIPVWDADRTVEELYSEGGEAVSAVGKIAPGSIVGGAVSKSRLRAQIAEDPKVLDAVEAVVHPLVARHRQRFLDQHNTEALVVLDIPLFFEAKQQQDAHGVLVVSAPADVQRERVMDRGTMDEATFKMILSRQVPDEEKRKRADFVIETLTMKETHRNVLALIDDLKAQR